MATNGRAVGGFWGALSSHSGTPTQLPLPPGVATPAASSRSRPVDGGIAGTVSVVVSTARSGAILASSTCQP